MLLEFVTKSYWLQNLFINVVSSFHPSITHNIAKTEMLKMAFFHAECEAIGGGYFEFGVYEGTSLYAAATLNKRITSTIPRTLYGFDSFDDGFKYSDERDRHPFWKEGEFKSSYRRVAKRLRRFKNVKLIKGYFEETVRGKDIRQVYPGERCAILFIDCDFMIPARIALDFVRPVLQKGTVIILDDYWAYKADPELGECGALNQFLRENKGIEVRPWKQYGHWGKSFVVTKV